MSKIQIVTGVTEASVKFRKNVSAIQVIMTGDFVTTLDYTTPKAVIYLSNTSKAKHITFFDKTNIIDLLELGVLFRERTISLFGSVGLVADTSLAVGTITPIQGKRIIGELRGQVDLTNGANGIQPLDGDDVVIELTNLNAANIYEFYAVEEDDINTIDANNNIVRPLAHAFKYHTVSTNGERNYKVTDVSGITRIAVEKNTSFDSIEVGFKDGTNIKLDPIDLRLEQYDSFGDCYETSLVIPGITLGDVQMISAIDKETKRNWIVPIDEKVKYVQINVNEVVAGGVTTVPSLRVISIREQVTNA